MITEEVTQIQTAQTTEEVQAPFDMASHVNRLCGNLFENQIVELNGLPIRVLKAFNVYEEFSQLKDSFKSQGSVFSQESDFIDWLVFKGHAVQISDTMVDVEAIYETFPLCPTSRQIHSAALLVNVNIGDEALQSLNEQDIYLYALTYNLRRFMIHDEAADYLQRIKNTINLMSNVLEVLSTVWKIEYVTNPDLDVISQVKIGDRPVTGFFDF